MSDFLKKHVPVCVTLSILLVFSMEAAIDLDELRIRLFYRNSLSRHMQVYLCVQDSCNIPQYFSALCTDSVHFKIHYWVFLGLLMFLAWGS